MIRVLFGLAGSVALAGAQVRQGGVYQIQSETLNAGGGTASGGNYSVLQTLPALGGAAAGGAYALLSGFAGQGGVSGGTGSGPAAFAAWQTAFFGDPSDTQAGPYLDPDGDGVPNLLEFAFNLPPLTPGGPLAVPGALSGLPWIREESLDGARYFTMDYIRRKNAGSFLPEFSHDMVSWAPVAFTVLSGPVSMSGAYERLKLRLGAAIVAGDKVFYRMKAVIQ